MPTLLDFLLKLLFAEHVSSVSLCHFSSLPQFVRTRMFVGLELRSRGYYQPICRILSRIFTL